MIVVVGPKTSSYQYPSLRSPVIGSVMPHNLKQSACRSFRYIGQRWSESQGPLLIRRYHASTLQRPCPTPAVAAAQSDVKVATLATNGSPLLTTNHPSDVPCLLPGRIERVRVSIASPAHRSLPQLAGGSTSALLLKLHSRYSPSDRSAAQRTLSRGSSPASGLNHLKRWVEAL